MARKCHFPDRNLCCPDDLIAALFIDLDGTCVVCQPYYDGAIDEFGTLMQLCRLATKEEAIQTLRRVYYGSMPQRGFERARFGEAIVEAYHQLCTKRRPPRKEITAICQSIGSRPFFRPPEVFPGCKPVLSRAQHNFLLVAVTVGDYEVQRYKMKQSGLDPIFDDHIITDTENKPQVVQEFIKDVGIHPQYSGFIGNSMRSDGAVLSVTNVLYLPLESSLARPEDKFPENTGFELFQARNWAECEQRGIMPLFRRRRKAMEETADACA
ncbi:MAG TPA: HAD family hydrolase [Candidatus Obscuribacterales bacterium]